MNRSLLVSLAEPVVDVVIPAFEQGRFLTEAIESVLAQTYRNVAVTVIDDGSSDDTELVATRYSGRIGYHRTAHAGLSAARNTGIRATSGALLLFLDADDYLASDAVQRHVDAACSHPYASVFHGSWTGVDIYGHKLWDAGPYPLDTDPLHRLWEGYCPPPNVIMVRREAVTGVGLFDVGLRLQEDWDMWLRLAAAGHRFVTVPQARSFYRRHATSMSATASAREVVQACLARAGKPENRHRRCQWCRAHIGRDVRMWRRRDLALRAGGVAAALFRGQLAGRR